MICWVHIVLTCAQQNTCLLFLHTSKCLRLFSAFAHTRLFVSSLSLFSLMGHIGSRVAQSILSLLVSTHAKHNEHALLFIFYQQYTHPNYQGHFFHCSSALCSPLLPFFFLLVTVLSLLYFSFCPFLFVTISLTVTLSRILPSLLFVFLLFTTHTLYLSRSLALLLVLYSCRHTLCPGQLSC